MKQRGDKQTATGEQLQANAVVQAYCSTLDAYINAVVVGSTQHGTCVVTLLGVTETLEVEVGLARSCAACAPPLLQSCHATAAGAIAASWRSCRPRNFDLGLKMRRSVSACCRRPKAEACSHVPRRYSADGYFYKATVLKALYPGDLEYALDYQTYAEKAG